MREVGLLDGALGTVAQKARLGLRAICASAIAREVVNVVARGRTRTAGMERRAGLASLGLLRRSLDLCSARLELSDQTLGVLALRMKRVPLVTGRFGESLAGVLGVNLLQAVGNLGETRPQFLDGDDVAP